MDTCNYIQNIKQNSHLNLAGDSLKEDNKSTKRTLASYSPIFRCSVNLNLISSNALAKKNLERMAARSADLIIDDSLYGLNKLKALKLMAKGNK